jgi:hypothetical protein
MSDVDVAANTPELAEFLISGIHAGLADQLGRPDRRLVALLSLRAIEQAGGPRVDSNHKVCPAFMMREWPAPPTSRRRPSGI